jgi:hypothetical protein
MIRSAMLLAAGTRLGPYEILAPLGAGGHCYIPFFMLLISPQFFECCG